MPDLLNCPACRAEMQSRVYACAPAGLETLASCAPCQALWFGSAGTRRLSAAGMLALLKDIEAMRALPREHTGPLQCTRCTEHLYDEHNIARGGAYTYHACPRGHGSFYSVRAFLVEREYLRPIHPAELPKVLARATIIRCDGCGAPVDLSKGSYCEHCRAPVAVLDPRAVQAALSAEGQTVEAQTLGKFDLADVLLMRVRLPKESVVDRYVRHTEADLKVLKSLFGMDDL